MQTVKFWKESDYFKSSVETGIDIFIDDNKIFSFQIIFLSLRSSDKRSSQIFPAFFYKLLSVIQKGYGNKHNIP